MNDLPTLSGGERNCEYIEKMPSSRREAGLRREFEDAAEINRTLPYGVRTVADLLPSVMDELVGGWNGRRGK
jgi:hypothetical protein